MWHRTARTLRRAAVAGAQQRRGASAVAATRPWHEPDILSTETKQFRDAELAALGALRDAAAAGLDGPAAASPAAACLDASVTEASGDAPQLLAAFARRARAAAAQGAGAPAETLRLAYAARYAEALARRALPRQERGDAARPGAGALASAVAAVVPEADLPFAGALRREGAAARLEAALRAACVGDAAARVEATHAFVDDRAEGLSVKAAAAALEAAALPVGEAIADAHDILVRAPLAEPADAGEAGRWKARRRRGLVRRARKDAARHLDRNARDRLDVPAKARNAAHWAEPDREIAQPPPPAAMSVEWLTQRRDPHAGARLAAPTLAAASAEFFPEHATLGATLATSLLRHREQAWRDAEEDYLSRLLTLAFCAFCGVADYAIMVH